MYSTQFPLESPLGINEVALPRSSTRCQPFKKFERGFYCVVGLNDSRINQVSLTVSHFLVKCISHDSDLRSMTPQDTKDYSGWNFIED